MGIIKDQGGYPPLPLMFNFNKTYIMNQITTAEGITKGVKYIGNTKMCVEWVSVFSDNEGKHYIYSPGGYREISSNFDIFKVY